MDVDFEVSILGSSFDNTDQDPELQTIEIDASWIGKQILNAYLGLIVAVNEACIFSIPEESLEKYPFLEESDDNSAAVVLRVRGCNFLEEDAAAETVGYHCYRGIIGPGTTFYLTAAEKKGPQVQLNGAIKRPPTGDKSHVISIYTNDGECFPVHRKLLRPCIALTKAVRTASGVSASVDIDTLTFDRVLIFLGNQALGKEPPSFGIHLIPALQQAAKKLSLGSLLSWCEERLGASEAKRRWHSFAEIEQRNATGECLLTMDGMVFDVTAWLSEHPGGSRIIPAQALNIDSSRFFELYHASRESFIYLREFYVGEIRYEDRDVVPRPSTQPSEDFLRQLRQWTDEFRLKIGEGNSPRNFKSF